jgi:hypothetical protein
VELEGRDWTVIAVEMDANANAKVNGRMMREGRKSGWANLLINDHLRIMLLYHRTVFGIKPNCSICQKHEKSIKMPMQ